MEGPLTTPRPAPGVSVFLLDDEGLLFIEPLQEIHALNTSATVIWCLMEEGLDAAGIAAALQAASGLDALDVASFVAAALTDWGARGFLAGAGVSSKATPAAATPAPGALRLNPDPVFAGTRHYRLGPLRFSVRFTAPDQDAIVHPTLAHLEADAAQGATLFDIVAGPAGSLELLRDGAACAACEALDQLAPVVKSLVWQAGLDAQSFLLDIHAGVVAGEAGCVLLPAPPGSGKSTLTAALVRAGLDFLSDEVALLADGTLEAIPFPLALCVKDTGLDVVARLFPHAWTLPLHRRGDGKRVAYLPPPVDRIPAHDARRSVAAVVFPSYAPGAACACRPLGKVEAAERLFAQCLGVATRLDAGRVGRMVEWLRRVPCHELVFADVSAAADAVLRMAHHEGTLAASPPAPHVVGGPECEVSAASPRSARPLRSRPACSERH